MEEPIVAQPFSYKLELEPGVYLWCACGRSKSQPFCDRSHQGTPFRPVKVEITETRRIALCGCKRSAEGPVCDGTHKTLSPREPTEIP